MFLVTTTTASIVLLDRYVPCYDNIPVSPPPPPCEHGLRLCLQSVSQVQVFRLGGLSSPARLQVLRGPQQPPVAVLNYRGETKKSKIMNGMLEIPAVVSDPPSFGRRWRNGNPILLGICYPTWEAVFSFAGGVESKLFLIEDA